MIVLSKRRISLRAALAAALILSSPALAAGPDPAKAPIEPAVRDIRVQVVAETSASIGAPMAGRLVQFPLKDGERFTQGQVLARFFCAEKEGALGHARALLEGKRQVFASKQKLHNLGSSSEVEFQVAQAEVQEATADVTTAQALVDACVVVAPFSGRVSGVFTHNFQFLGTGAPLLEILSDKDLDLELIVPSLWLAWLKPGAAFDVAIDETGKTYPAKITRLSGKVDAVSRSVKVYGKIDGPVDALLPGMSGRALLSPPTGGAPGQ
ncbi:MAG TPA: HlyD family efflux transporter periplasmic adaptor subunit [Aliidongia sp.]|nr:HlyD family efflux transporter periplasmic adaptor subunit [Aliidongia sp.]